MAARYFERYCGRGTTSDRNRMSCVGTYGGILFIRSTLICGLNACGWLRDHFLYINSSSRAKRRRL
jgi:hypothetical protein